MTGCNKKTPLKLTDYVFLALYIDTVTQVIAGSLRSQLYSRFAWTVIRHIAANSQCHLRSELSVYLRFAGSLIPGLFALNKYIFLMEILI